MQVHIQNDGPVTIPLDSPDNLPDSKKKENSHGSAICSVSLHQLRRGRQLWLLTNADLAIHLYPSIYSH